MTSLLYLAEHNVFMGWFKNHYPQLNKQYGIFILPATNDSGFCIDSKNLDKETFNALLQIINDYRYFLHK